MYSAMKKNIASIAKLTMNATMFAPRNVRDAEEARSRPSASAGDARPPRSAPSARTAIAYSASSRAEPQCQFVALHEREHERCEAARQERDAGQVDPLRDGLIARLAHGEQRDDDRADGDRQVQEEDRLPADGLNQEAAQDRTDGERQRGDARPRADRLAALGWRERVGDDRQRRRASSSPSRRPAPRATRPARCRLGEKPIAPLETANTITPARNILRRPNRSPRRPPVTSSTAKDSV